MAWWRQPRRLTTGYVAVWRDPNGPGRILAVAVAVTILNFLAIALFARGGIPVAIAAPVGAVLGPAGVWGVGIGALVGELAGGGTPALVATVPIGAWISAFVGRTLWLQLAYPYRVRPFVAAVAILPVAAVATLLGTGVAVSGAAAIGDVGIAAQLPTLAVERILPSLLVAPVLAAGSSEWGGIPVSGMTTPPTRWLLTVCAIGVVTAGWIGATTLLDLLRADVRMTSELRGVVTRRLPPVLDHFAGFVLGPWGWVIHVLFAMIAATLVVVALFSIDLRPNRRRRERVAARESGCGR